MDYKTLYEKTKDLSLLFVEDYAPLREDMTEMLEDLFKTVVVASNGVEALKVYRAHVHEHGKHVDIVITDIVMPYMNGVDLCEILRKENETQPIVVLSAYTDSAYLLRLINLGIAQFINKPIEQDTLLETLYAVSEKLQTKVPSNASSHMVHFDDTVVWNKNKKMLLREQIPVSLTRHESIVMQLFVEKSEQVCTFEVIMNYFYLEGIDLDEKNIRNLVFKLRKKLPKRAIESLYGLGYKFIPLPLVEEK